MCPERGEYASFDVQLSEHYLSDVQKTLLEFTLPIRFAPLPVCGTPTELATSTALARTRYRPVAPGSVVQAERTG